MAATAAAVRWLGMHYLSCRKLALLLLLLLLLPLLPLLPLLLPLQMN
jgi:hypothetical protein